MLPHIQHVLWVHGQYLTNLGPNQCTRILFIQASEYPSCGTRFSESCKTTKPSSDWCIFFGEEPHVIDVLQSIPHALWVHGQGLTINTIDYVHPSLRHPSCCGTRSGENCKTATKPPSHPQVAVWHYMKNHMPWMCCNSFDMS